MELQQAVTMSVFAAVLIVSAFKVVHPAAIALAGALGLAVWLGPTAALAGVKADVLLTAAGVMVLGGFLKRSGVVSWLALKAAKNARGRPSGILARTALMAFVAGALLGPGAAALVLPVALLLAVELDVPSLPFIVTLLWCSLLGATAVLTSQPGNLWVGSTLGLDSWHWLVRMAPLAAALAAATLVLALVLFRRSLRVTNERRARVLEYDERKALEDKPLTTKTIIVVVLVILGVAAQPLIHVDPVLIVLSGGLLLTLLAGRSSVAAVLAEVDGTSLLWYGAVMSIAGLFTVSTWADATSASSSLAWLWGSAVVGSFVDPGTVAGSASMLQAAHGMWPLLVLGSSVGGGVTLWSLRSSALNGAVKGPRGPGWARVVLWGLLFAAVNLVLLSAVFLLIR